MPAPVPPDNRKPLTWFLAGLSAIVIVVALVLAGTVLRASAGPLALFALVVFVAGAAAAVGLHRGIDRSLRELARRVGKLRAGDFSAQAAPTAQTPALGELARELDALQAELDRKFSETGREKQRSERILSEVIPLGVQLMTEKDYNGLLERMLRLAQTFCIADGGTLYLKTEDNYLRFEIIHTDSRGVAMGGVSQQPIPFAPLPMYDPLTGEPNHSLLATYVALTGETYNFPSFDETGQFDRQVRESVLYHDYPIHSMLTLPLVNPNRQVVGVLQLINARDPDTGAFIAFDAGMQRWMQSFSFLAVAALEAYVRERTLKQEIEDLRVEVDVARRERQVKEIVETDFFKRISQQASEMRHRRKGK